MEPEVLLMDEPLSALDALTRGTLQDEIERIWAADRKTAVLVTNDVDEALRLADRLIPLSPGPRGTLGEPIRIEIPRPRDRKALLHDRHYQELRAHVIDRLRNNVRQRVQPTSVMPKMEVAA
jgi:nitrate/nitrite transport system ATP-binding protein